MLASTPIFVGEPLTYRLWRRLVRHGAMFCLVITVASAVIGAVAWRRLSRAIDAASEAEQFRRSMNQLLWVLQNAETNQRGFLLTGKESYFDAFVRAERAFPRAFDRLTDSAMAERSRQEEWLHLRRLMENKLGELRQVMALGRKKGFTSAFAVLDLNQATSTMDRIDEIMKRSPKGPLALLSLGGEGTRGDMMSAYHLAWMASLLGLGASLFLVCFYWGAYCRERRQRQLLEERLQCEEAVQEKSVFLANMSHEIRTPMNAILGFSELLEPEGLTPKQSQYVRAIRDSGASLLQLINDILDLTKLEAGKLELYPEPTDLWDSCEFLRTLFGQQALKKSLQLQFELSPALPGALLLDRLRLRQILVNLLGNAIKFTEVGCVKTRVSWQAHAIENHGTLLIDVEDTGMGIAPDRLQEVFKAFVQADSRRTAEKQGTGLGLTIVKRLTEVMDGTLTVESIVGKGTVFHLRFDHVSVSARLPVGDHAKPEGAVDFNDFVAATLLVVDDNEVNQELMAGMFEKSQHTLHFATNGKEALECLGKLKVDVVLLDIRMPVMDGRTALTEIRKRPGLASVPIIAVTASSPASQETNLRGQFSGYIRKPFSRQTLFQALTPFLQRGPSEEPQELQNSRKVAIPIFAPPPERVADWRALSVELCRLLNTEWPTLRDTLAINETRYFAHKLCLLGKAAECAPLASYAERLATLADAYAIGDLERQLAEFPTLVKSIEATSAQCVYA